MNYLKVIITLFALLLAHQAAGQELVNKQLDLVDEQRQQRPVKLDVWYKAANKACDQAICIATTNKKVPVAILSHGAFGAAKELNWLGYSLASQGWLVIGLSHFGESWVYGKNTINPANVGKYWLRSQDVSFALDQLFEGKLSNKAIDNNKVVVIGHSSGGYTGLSLIGADFNPELIANYCQSKNALKDKGCSYGKKKPSKKSPKQLPSLIDNRVKAVIALDPALGPAVSQQALANISVPVMVVGAVNNDFLPFNHHAKYYTDNIKNAKLLALNNGEGHFSFIDQCSHSFQAQGIKICQDRKGVNRQIVHQQLIPKISTFINELD